MLTHSTLLRVNPEALEGLSFEFPLGSLFNLHRFSFQLSSFLVRARAFDDDSERHAPLLFHRPAIIAPVGMLSFDLAVPGDQRLHRFRQRNNIRPAVDLYPLRPVKGVGKNTERSSRVAAEIFYFIRGLAAGDEDPPLVVDAGRDRRHLEPAVALARDKHAAMVC